MRITVRAKYIRKWIKSLFFEEPCVHSFDSREIFMFSLNSKCKKCGIAYSKTMYK